MKGAMRESRAWLYSLRVASLIIFDLYVAVSGGNVQGH